MKSVVVKGGPNGEKKVGIDELKIEIKRIFAWIGFHMSHSTWASVSGEGKGCLYFCIGGGSMMSILFIFQY